MSTQKNEAFLLSRERENIFDDYYNSIENVKLEFIREQTPVTPDYDTLIKSLTILERNIDDLASKGLQQKDFETLNMSIVQVLKDWLKIFEILIKQPNFIESFSYNLLGLANIIANNQHNSLIENQKTILFFSPSRKDRQNYEKTLKVGFDLETAVDQFYHENWPLIDTLLEGDDLIKSRYSVGILRSVKASIEGLMLKKGGGWLSPGEFSPLLAQTLNDNFKNNIFRLNFKSLRNTDQSTVELYRQNLNALNIANILHSIIHEDNYIYVWDIDVTIRGETFKADQIGFLMWTISKALQSIEGVSILLEDWGNGSKRFKLKAFIKNIFAKEEVKQILDKGRKAAEAKYLETPIEEAEKLRAEKEKVMKETSVIISSDLAKEGHELDLMKKRLEIQDKAAEIALKRLQAIKGLSELIKEGILSNDSDFQIMINDLLFLEKQSGKLRSGESIELIEAKEIKNDAPSAESSNL